MSDIPCFTIGFSEGAPHIQNQITLENGVLILGGGVAEKRFDTFFPSANISFIRPKRIRDICTENLRSLPKTCTSGGSLVLVKTGAEFVLNTLPGHSQAFKGAPFKIISGRYIRFTSNSEPSRHTDSLWFLMPDDKVLVVEQGNTSNAGIIVTWRDGELKAEKLPREYFSEESE